MEPFLCFCKLLVGQVIVICNLKTKNIKHLVDWWRIGFLRIFTVAFEKLLLVRLVSVRVNECPGRLEN